MSTQMISSLILTQLFNSFVKGTALAEVWLQWWKGSASTWRDIAISVPNADQLPDSTLPLSVKESVYSKDINFFQHIESDKSTKEISIKINFEQGDDQRDFMAVIVNIERFELQISDALSSSSDVFKFEDDRTAFSLIDKEIEQRRILFGHALKD